jgi:hypothetical protein
VVNELKVKDLGQYLISIRLRLWFVFLGIAGLVLVGCQGVGGLRPLPPDIESNQIISSQPQLVTFTELEADPTIYQDKLIRVTGTYVTLPVVSCSPYSGPNTSWALVADGLRLDMLGFEGLLNQFNVEEMNLTLDGILRRYDGPLGCGKRPEPGVLWYLEAQQIVQPNPLVQADTGPSGDPSIVPPPFPTGTSLPPGEELPEEEPTTGPGTPSRTPTPTTTAVATASSTPTIEPDGTPSPQSTTIVTRTPTRTPTPTQTAPAGGGTSTPSPTPSQTPTPGSGSTPLPTATPGGGYPGDPTPYP